MQRRGMTHNRVVDGTGMSIVGMHVEVVLAEK